MNLRRHDHGHTGDRGNISVALVLLTVLALAGGGLIFDGGRYLAAERHASNTAEGAARAAIATANPDSGVSEHVARQAAIDHAVAAGVNAADVVVTFPTPVSVLVVVAERREAVFGRFAGQSTLTASAEGRARWEYAS